jgi:hypothetical protein
MQAADQYLLEPLKANCAALIAKQLTPANVLAQYEVSRQFNSNKLMHSTMAYVVLEADSIQVHVTSFPTSRCQCMPTDVQLFTHSGQCRQRLLIYVRQERKLCQNIVDEASRGITAYL